MLQDRRVAETLALAYEPDQAATTALEALCMASKPRFGGTLEQLVRVCTQLRPYADRTPVRDLHQQLSALAA